MKKLCVVFCFVLILSLLCGCGRVWGARVSVTGDGELHSDGDIHRAMGTVRRFFRRHYDGCQLDMLIYEASHNIDRGNSRHQMVITTTFTVDASNTSGPLEPGETYENYSWELERGFLGRWKLVNWGYG